MIGVFLLGLIVSKHSTILVEMVHYHQVVFWLSLEELRDQIDFNGFSSIFKRWMAEEVYN